MVAAQRKERAQVAPREGIHGTQKGSCGVSYGGRRSSVTWSQQWQAFMEAREGFQEGFLFWRRGKREGGFAEAKGAATEMRPIYADRAQQLHESISSVSQADRGKCVSASAHPVQWRTMSALTWDPSSNSMLPSSWALFTCTQSGSRTTAGTYSCHTADFQNMNGAGLSSTAQPSSRNARPSSKKPQPSTGNWTCARCAPCVCVSPLPWGDTRGWASAPPISGAHGLGSSHATSYARSAPHARSLWRCRRRWRRHPAPLPPTDEGAQGKEKMGKSQKELGPMQWGHTLDLQREKLRGSCKATGGTALGTLHWVQY